MARNRKWSPFVLRDDVFEVLFAYGMERSWLKIKNPTYSQAEGRHDFFERRKGPESVKAAKLAANA